MTQMVPDGLELAGRAHAFPKKPWYRCEHCGVWAGSVTFEVRYADGRERTQILRDQLAHADALAPRYDGRAI